MYSTGMKTNINKKHTYRCRIARAIGCNLFGHVCPFFFVQGLTPHEAVRGTKVVILDNPPLVYYNAVEFVFLPEAVWSLWACPFSRSQWEGTGHKKRQMGPESVAI